MTEPTKSKLEQYRYLLDLLPKASTNDLRASGWFFPPLPPGLKLKIQREGVRLFGDRFHDIGPNLEAFSHSRFATREKTPGGDLIYASSPLAVSDDMLIYSGTLEAEFAEFRLALNLEAPFADCRFQHRDTHWYNICNRIGMLVYFWRNSGQIHDFFAELVVKRLRQGKRCLLVAKKRLIPFCVTQLERRLHKLGKPDCRIITDWQNFTDLDDERFIPLINYGVIGVNAFQNFDCAYCLSGYYVNEKVVNHTLQDVLASDYEIPITITTKGKPRRRWAGVTDPDDRFYDVHRLAPLALRQQELDPVIQAVGRVRPFTKPREIITFQCDAHPDLPYDREFLNLAEAREFFGIDSKRERGKAETAQAVRQARERGLKQLEAAEELGLSERTVRRYWKY